jgi:GTP-binding protein YchF
VKIGLVGLPGGGKTSVFGALTGLAVETGYGGKGGVKLGAVKVPDARVDALARLYEPKKTTYAEITFSDLPGGHEDKLDRKALNAMRDVDALCQVLRGFENAAGDAADPLRELSDLETETILADLELIERRVERLRKDRSSPRELELLERIQSHLEGERALRSMTLGEEELAMISGYSLLTLKPLLLVYNVAEEAVAEPAPEALAKATSERGLGLVVLSAQVEMEIAQLSAEEQPDFLESLGLQEPASHRFVRAAFELIDLVSMLTVGPDECRAWPVPRGIVAPRAAGKIHSDIERGFIRAEVTPWQDLVELGSEAKCREAGKLRVEGKDYVVQDGDVVHFRFNV